MGDAMKSHYVFLLETGLFEGAALAWGIWELWSLRRRKDETPTSKPAAAENLPKAPGHPER
jgi:hypothetical protein